MTDSRHIHASTYYALAAVIGALTGVLGAAFHLLVEQTLSGTHHLPTLLGLEGPMLYVVMALFSAMMFCAAVALVRCFVPEASGSGVQEIEGAMAGLREVRWKRVLPVKFIGGILALGAGLVGGREGPTIHMGASIAKAIGDRFTMRIRDARALLGAGGAAGLTAAFNAPLAASLFVIEEARKVFPYSKQRYLAVILACVCSAIATTAITGTTPYMALTSDYMPARFLPAFVLLGILLGVIGVIFNRTILVCLDLARQLGLKTSPYLLPLILGCIIGPLLVAFPEATGGGESLVSVLAKHPLPIGLLAIVVLARFIMTAASYSIGAPAGIFAPILALAAALGSLLGNLLALIMPLPVDGLVAFTVAGMAGLFASTVRAPLVGVVLVIELTGSYALAIPALLTSMTAAMISIGLGGNPIYEELLKRTLRLAEPPQPPQGSADQCQSHEPTHFR